MRRYSWMLVPLAVTLAACGNDAIGPVTGGPGSGATGFSVVLTDDPATSPTGSIPTAPTTLAGNLSGAVRVALRNDAGTLVDLGLSQSAQVPLRAGSDTVALRNISRPPAGSYVGVLLSFEGATATVLAGSQLADTTLAQTAVLGVGTTGLAVVEFITPPFAVTTQNQVRVVVDLNAERWITRNSLIAGAVSQAELANNVTVAVQ